MDKDFENLLALAKGLADARELNAYATAGQVGCALMTASGKIYTGISLTAMCGLGNCAEYAAIMDMLKDGETRILKIVSYSYKGTVYPPCGRCRELIKQIDEGNFETEMMVSTEGRVRTLRELLPEPYVKKPKSEWLEEQGRGA